MTSGQQKIKKKLIKKNNKKKRIKKKYLNKNIFFPEKKKKVTAIYTCRDSNSGFPACEAGVMTRLDHTCCWHSPTGNRTRVVWVKTTYPDQLDYWGVRRPGIKPGSRPWQGRILSLYYRRIIMAPSQGIEPWASA